MKNPRLVLSISTLTCLFLLLTMSSSPAQEKLPATWRGQSITEFEGTGAIDFEWQIVNDGVMGGLSKGTVEITKEGTLRFTGDLSLKNNGGFSSVRSQDISLDLSNDLGFLLRVKGDGRTYQIRSATDARFRGMEVSFSGEFETKAGEWIVVQVPFTSMKGSFRGMNLEKEVFDPARVQRLGFILSDKKEGPFALEVDWIQTYGKGQGKEASDRKVTKEDGAVEGSELVGVLAGDSRFQTLVAALKAADLLSVFGKGDAFTVLAPTDEAFAKLPDGTVEKLLQPESREELRRILTHHVVAGKASLAGLLKSGGGASLEGSELVVKFSEGRVRINDAALLEADVEASDGIVHVIDSVLLPPEPEVKTILTTAEAAGGFSTLLAAIGAAGLDGVLGGEGPFTVFAPSDEAFSAIPKEKIAELLRKENRDELVSLLTTHVVKGRVRAGDALNAGTAESLSGTTLNFAVADGRLQVNGSTITTVDLDGGNGIIHVIDAVLSPTSEADGKSEKPGKRLSQMREFREKASEKIVMAIEKGVPLYNSGDAAACAEVYEDCILSIAELTGVDARTREMLTKVVEGGKSHLTPDSRAWLYRRTLDGMMHFLQRPID